MEGPGKGGGGGGDAPSFRDSWVPPLPPIPAGLRPIRGPGAPPPPTAAEAAAARAKSAMVFAAHLLPAGP
eukprot:6908194-Alexandrium_andersonii.AAC.1